MQKLLMAMAFVFATGCLFAASQNDLRVTFWSTGPDAYRDGKTLVDGERYALVWTKSGSTFAGFAANGTLVDATASRLVVAGPWAKGGSCRPIFHAIDAAEASAYAAGAFSLVALDTRNADGTVSAPRYDADGNLVLSVVNGWSAVAQSMTSADGLSRAIDSTGGILIDTSSALPEGIPQPEITRLEMVELNGEKMMKLTVRNTVPYLRYAARAVALEGSTPGDGEIGANGAETPDREVEVFVPVKGEKGFFKVMRQ